MNFKLFLESNLTYHAPKDKKQLMYDFYVLQMLYKKPSKKYQDLNDKGYVVTSPEPNFRDMDRNELADYQIQEIAKILIPHLKQELLDVVYFAIAAEARHFHDSSWSGGLELGANNVNILDKFAANNSDPDEELPRYLQNYKYDNYDDDGYGNYADYFNNTNKEDTTDEIGGVPRTFGKRNKKERVTAYKSSQIAADSREKFVLAARDVFRNYHWRDDYGGEAWALIADAWLNLSKSKSIPEMMVQIDHIYDIQHNSGTVFNKVKSYEKTGTYNPYQWIQFALDYKANVNNPIEMIKFASPMMRRIVLPAIKDKYGSSLESHNNDIKKEKEDASKYFRSVNGIMQSPDRSLARVIAVKTKYLPEKNSDAIKYINEIADKAGIKVDATHVIYQSREEKNKLYYWLIGYESRDYYPHGIWMNMPKISKDEKMAEKVLDELLNGNTETFEKATLYNRAAISNVLDLIELTKKYNIKKHEILGSFVIKSGD